MTTPVPVNVDAVAAREDYLLETIAVEVAEDYLQGKMGGQPEGIAGIEAVLRAPVHERVCIVLEFLAIVGHHQFGTAVAVEIFAGDAEGGDALEPVALRHLCKAASFHLLIDLDEPSLARIVVIYPGRGKDQIQPPATAQIHSCHIVGPRGGQLGARPGESLRLPQ